MSSTELFATLALVGTVITAIALLWNRSPAPSSTPAPVLPATRYHWTPPAPKPETDDCCTRFFRGFVSTIVLTLVGFALLHPFHFIIGPLFSALLWLFAAPVIVLHAIFA